MVVSSIASIGGRPGGRRWWRVAPLLLVLAAASPAAAKETHTVAPAGTASWPELLRRDPAVIKALGGRRRTIPFFAGSQRSVGGQPAVPLPSLAPPAPAGLAGGPVTVAASSPTLATSFLALPDTNTVIPPDTMGAAGPAHLMVMLNSQVRIQSKSGTDLGTVSLATFWTGGTGLSGDRGVHENGDAVIGFSRSDATRYAEAVYAGRLASDPPGTMAPPAVLKLGEDAYVKTFGSGTIRWGD